MMTRSLLFSYFLKDRVAEDGDAGARSFGNGFGARSVWGVADRRLGSRLTGFCTKFYHTNWKFWTCQSKNS